MKKLYNLSVIMGFVLIIGTSGSSDLDYVSISQTVFLVISGFALCLFGTLVPKYASAKKRHKRLVNQRKILVKTSSSVQMKDKETEKEKYVEGRKRFVLIKEV